MGVVLVVGPPLSSLVTSRLHSRLPLLFPTASTRGRRDVTAQRSVTAALVIDWAYLLLVQLGSLS